VSHGRDERGKTIFRERALRLYQENRQKIVLLRLVRPKFFLLLWGLLGGLAVLVGVAWSAPVPITATGIGLVLERAEPAAAPGHVILALLPPGRAGDLAPEQKVVVRDDALRPILVARIETVEPGVLSPDAIRHRFGLAGAAADMVRGPAAVAVGRIEVETGGLPVSAYAGGSFPLDVELGSRRAISLMTGLGNR
jgi:hypothetical protein